MFEYYSVKNVNYEECEKRREHLRFFIFNSMHNKIIIQLINLTHVCLNLSSSAFVDYYETSSLKYLISHSRNITSLEDLEYSSYDNYNCFLFNATDTISIPFHYRYQSPFDQLYTVVNESYTVSYLNQAVEGCNVEFSVVDGYTKSVLFNVPTGLKIHQNVVFYITMIVTWIGAIYLILGVLNVL